MGTLREVVLYWQVPRFLQLADRFGEDLGRRDLADRTLDHAGGDGAATARLCGEPTDGGRSDHERSRELAAERSRGGCPDAGDQHPPWPVRRQSGMVSRPG